MENTKTKALTPGVSNLLRYRNRVRESANIGKKINLSWNIFLFFCPIPLLSSEMFKCTHTHTHTLMHTTHTALGSSLSPILPSEILCILEY